MVINEYYQGMSRLRKRYGKYEEVYLRDSVGVRLCFYKEGEKVRTIINVYTSDTAQINLNMTYYLKKKH